MIWLAALCAYATLIYVFGSLFAPPANAAVTLGALLVNAVYLFWRSMSLTTSRLLAMSMVVPASVVGMHSFPKSGSYTFGVVAGPTEMFQLSVSVAALVLGPLTTLVFAVRHART